MSTATSTMLQPIPYVSFPGNCAEAIAFYAETLGGTIRHMMTFGDMPGPDQMPPEIAGKIMNAHLDFPGGGMMYGGDCPPHMDYKGIHGIGLALKYDTIAEAEAAFNKLAVGGTIVMPFGPTFWAKGFGMVDDKFGVSWMLNGEMEHIS